MSTNNTTTHYWPPLFYMACALLSLLGLALGTSVQFQTNIAWALSIPLQPQSVFATGSEIIDLFFASGTLNSSTWIPAVTAFAIQLASVGAAAGMELPKNPKYRYWAVVGLMFILIAINSTGDWESTAMYPVWLRALFVACMLFLTFVCSVLFTQACIHVVKSYRHHGYWGTSSTKKP